ncbi:hypothetical protein F6I32_03730 [Streptococcus anginosus]|nr:hypothetical protein F6I32_03730 [Streptococcus anginosus]
MENSSISDEHVFFVALHFTTRVYKTPELNRINKKTNNSDVLTNRISKLFVFCMIFMQLS